MRHTYQTSNISNSLLLATYRLPPMGNTNTLPSCLGARPTSRKVTVVLPGGATRLVKAPCPAAELLVEFPDQLLCHADSFLLNHPLPSLSLNDRLLRGQTYLLLPSDKFPSPVLSTASLASLSSSSIGDKKKAISFFGEYPLECVKDARGGTAIKISKEFLVRVLTGGGGVEEEGEEELKLCSTPELRRHYEQLVGSTRVQPWSPRLDTISEAKGRRSLFIRNLNLSPSRLIKAGALQAS